MNTHDPIVLTREQHVDHINRTWSRERVRRADDLAADIIFDDDLRRVGIAMAEPEPPSEKRAGHMLGALALNFLLWLPITIVFFAAFRP